MKNFITLIIFLTFITHLDAQEMITVKNVDLTKYVGLWYEIAKIPNRFQKQCVKGTTAQYKLLKDGKIEVINSCLTEEGEKDVADGIAQVVDKKNNSKLEVSFVSLFGIRLFWGDYWIIGLGDNYEYAVVGTPSRKYGWILSRSPQLDKQLLNKAYESLKSAGYDISKFEVSPQ
ncbi:MAG TPA: lipocalin family protein [Melioribacteraceae bacterium]|nr:lipocalin family protein [Melioribacteraceae bacterium]